MMFRKMRLTGQELSAEQTQIILQEGTSGVLALAEEGAYPYAVPVNYLYQKDRIYFHGAKSGQKIELIRKNPKASFCVIGREKIVPEKYTTLYQSVIAFGRIRIVEEEAEKRAAITQFTARFCPGDENGIQKEIAREWEILTVFVMEVEHMTGKQAMEFDQKSEKSSG